MTNLVDIKKLQQTQAKREPTIIKIEPRESFATKSSVTQYSIVLIILLSVFITLLIICEAFQ